MIGNLDFLNTFKHRNFQQKNECAGKNGSLSANFDEGVYLNYLLQKL